MPCKSVCKTCNGIGQFICECNICTNEIFADEKTPHDGPCTDCKGTGYEKE